MENQIENDPSFWCSSFLYNKYWGFWDPFDVDLFDNIVDLFVAEEVIEVD